MSIIDEGIELEVIWDGAHHNQNRDLFRRVEHEDQPKPVPFSVTNAAMKRQRDDEQAQTDRATVQGLLRHKAEWRTDELRRASGLDYRKFWAQLQRLTEKGQIEHLERGVVRWARVAA